MRHSSRNTYLKTVDVSELYSFWMVMHFRLWTMQTLQTKCPKLNKMLQRPSVDLTMKEGYKRLNHYEHVLEWWLPHWLNQLISLCGPTKRKPWHFFFKHKLCITQYVLPLVLQELELALSDCTSWGSAASATSAEAALPQEVRSMDDKSLCLLHGPRWRAKFQQILNLVRGTIIPSKYVKEVGMVVCICNRERDATLGQWMDTTASLLLQYLTYYKTKKYFLPLLQRGRWPLTQRC